MHPKKVARFRPLIFGNFFKAWKKVAKSGQDIPKQLCWISDFTKEYKNLPYNYASDYSAENFASLIMKFEKEIFGYDKFAITDTRLFSQDNDSLLRTVSLPDSMPIVEGGDAKC